MKIEKCKMKICVIGPSYVGLVTVTYFAEMGNDVTYVGRNPAKMLSMSIKRNYWPIG